LPIPLTYHITAGLEDDEYLRFLSEYYARNKLQSKTCWIVKPGEITNRGRGIQYCKNLSEIKPIIKNKQTHANGSLKTFLIQEYIDRPLLYKGRKFDIRHYIMISTIEGKIRGYFYR
jgi:tubulin---tyrosine ligase